MITSIYKRLAAVSLMIFLFGQLHGQIPTPPSSIPKVTPPSPNAAAFSKYGNIPVSPYTGVPNITIPIFEINSRDIKVPITLSYHASGIRVEDESSRVGLGWVLNAGGLISRNIVNRDDLQQLPDAYASAFNESPPMPEGPQSVPGAFTQKGTLFGYYNGAIQSTPILMNLTPFLVPQGNDYFFKPWDFEPDQFNYNFLSHSGKFVLNRHTDNSLEVVLEKQEKIRIKPTITTDNSSWEVTTPDGYIYKFLDFEFFIDTDNTFGYQQKSAWYLTEIISPQNERVQFYYTSLGQQHIAPVGSTYERIAPLVISCEGMGCRSQNSQNRLITGKNYSNISLESIVWSHGKIKFNMANDRQDIDGDKRLTSIQLFKKDAPEPYEEVIFSHDYFISPPSDPTSVNVFYTGKPDQEVKRLKLNGFTKRSLPNSNNQPEQYFFSYYEPTYLPAKNSYSRDHWGYFNGKANTSLIPSYKKVITGSPLLKDFIGIMGNERDPAPEHAQMLSLKTIVYPTKASTTFYYSSNEYEIDPNVIDTDEPEAYPETTFLLYDATKGNKGLVQTLPLDLRDEYVNREGRVLPVILRAAFKTNITVPCNGIEGTPNVYFELFDSANLSYGRITPNITRCSAPEDFGCISCVNLSPVFNYNGSFVLQPGKYYWKAFLDSTQVQISDISAGYTWMVDPKKRPQSITELDGSIKKYRTGGGLRISRIEDADSGSDQKVNVKKYVYGYKTDVDNNGVMESHSYGRRMVKPAYSYFDVSMERIPHRDIDGNITSFDQCLECITLVRDSGHPLANYNGNSVGYDKVIEYLGENGENGYTEYEFENRADSVRAYMYPYTEQNIPIRPPFLCTIKNPGNGNMKRQTHFRADHKKIMMSENSYSFKNKRIMYGLSSRKVPMDPEISPLTAPFIQILLIYDALNSYFSYLSETTTTSYLLTGEELTKIRNQYFYDDPEHLQLTQHVTFESNLHKTITNYTYPLDYPDNQASAAIMSMKGAKFMHSLPVETTVLDEAPDGTQKIKHREFTVYENFNTFTLPKEKVMLESTTLLPPADVPPYVPSGTYNAQLYKKAFTLDYNASGNLKKIQKNSDIPVGYLWGYNQTLPVAEIKNGTAEESFFTSFEEDGTLYTDVSGRNLARTGVKVKNASAYSFPADYTPVESNTLMSYWYLENNQWKFSDVIPFQRTISTPGSRIDEVRAFPKGAQMTTFTHFPIVGMSSQTDVNNITVYYEYDEMSRLKLIRDSNKKILKSYEYAYKK